MLWASMGHETESYFTVSPKRPENKTFVKYFQEDLAK
jgi:hypothetical protein